jgi:hypothetical protein
LKFEDKKSIASGEQIITHGVDIMLPTQTSNTRTLRKCAILFTIPDTTSQICVFPFAAGKTPGFHSLNPTSFGNSVELQKRNAPIGSSDTLNAD